MLLLALVIFIGVITRSVLMPAIVAAAVAGWLAWRWRERVLELVYGERVLLLKPVAIKLIEDSRSRVNYAKVELASSISPRAKKSELYGAFLRVKDFDPPRSSLGKAAERAVAALHHPSARITAVSVLREGGYEYYVGVWAQDPRCLLYTSDAADE